ncbi:MAG: hypothetical protein ABEJ56_04900 [Candidatus Nanohaloarchaea archaeon]
MADSFGLKYTGSDDKHILVTNYDNKYLDLLPREKLEAGRMPLYFDRVEGIGYYPDVPEERFEDAKEALVNELESEDPDFKKSKSEWQHGVNRFLDGKIDTPEVAGHMDLRNV